MSLSLHVSEKNILILFGILLGIIIIMRTCMLVNAQSLNNQSQAVSTDQVTPHPYPTIPWRSGSNLIQSGEIAPPQQVLEVQMNYALASSGTLPTTVSITSLRRINDYPTKSFLKNVGQMLNTLEKQQQTALSTLFFSSQPVKGVTIAEPVNPTIPQPLTTGEPITTPIPLPSPQVTPILTAQLLDNTGKILTSIDFILPNNLAYETSFHPISGGQQPTTQGTYSLALPWEYSANLIRILTNDNVELVNQAIGNPEIINNDPAYFAVRGDRVPLRMPTITPDTPKIITGKILKNDNYIPATNTYDIVFIGDKFTQNELPQFHNLMNEGIDTLNNTEPYRTRRSQIYYAYVDNTIEDTDLGCDTSQLTCNYAQIENRVYLAGLHYNQIIVIVNQNASPYRGWAFLGSQKSILARDYVVFAVAHEISHASAGVDDEYDYGAEGQINNQIINYNCFAGTQTPAPEWWFVGLLDYAHACHFSNWHSPSEVSIMRTGEGGDSTFYDTPTFNAISAYMNSITGVYPDNEHPTVHINYPTNGSVVTGDTMSINVSANDNNNIVRVGYWFSYPGPDPKLYHTEYREPFTYDFPIAGIPSGTYSLKAVPADAVGNIGLDQVTITIDHNLLTPIPPTITSTPIPSGPVPTISDYPAPTTPTRTLTPTRTPTPSPTRTPIQGLTVPSGHCLPVLNASYCTFIAGSGHCVQNITSRYFFCNGATPPNSCQGAPYYNYFGSVLNNCGGTLDTACEPYGVNNSCGAGSGYGDCTSCDHYAP